MYTRPALPPLLPAERGGREERERDVEIRIKRNCTFRPRGRKEKEGRTRFRLANANRFENPSETMTVSCPPFLFLLLSRFHLCLSFTFQRTKERSRHFSCAIHFFSFFFWFRESTGLKYDRIRPVHENKIAINEYRLKVDETGFVESRGLDICEYAKKKRNDCLSGHFQKLVTWNI